MFKKGQLVTLVGSWDNQGTVYYRDAVVYSCGKKQMVLTAESTGEELGRHFKPTVGNLDNVRFTHNWLGVYPRMTDAEAEALCLEAAVAILAGAMQHIDSRIAQYHNDRAFVRAMEKDREALHEPRVMKR